jgi:DNA polymerase/3'-5' exonuclease PolX
MDTCKFNFKLCKQLTFIANYYRDRGQLMPYGITYQKAVRALNEFNRPLKITDVFIPKKNTEITEENIKKSRGKFPVKGIGKGIAQKILQFLNSGYIDEYKLALSDKLLKKKVKQGKIKTPTKISKIIDELSKVSYIGKKTAENLVNNGFKSIKQLESASKKGKIDKKGNTVFEAPDKTKVKLTQNQQKMLKYHSKLKRIPRKFISVFEETVRYLLNNKYGSGTYDLVFGGSYRRGAKDSGDIDIIIKSTHFNLKNFIELLEKNKLVFDTLSLGNHDFKGLGRCPGMKDFIFRIDVLFTKEVNWIAALNHYTGNDVLNRLLREKAQKIRNWEGKKLPYGAILSQNGLFIRNSNSVSSKKRLIKGGLKTEKQLFDILGIKYLTPTKRGTK